MARVIGFRPAAVFVILLFLAFYSPFFFGGDHVYLTVHDNLDGEVPHSAVLGTFYVHPEKAAHLLLNGKLPIYLLPRLTWPLSMVNLINNRLAAYALNDLLVRLVAVVGMYLLARRIGLQTGLAALAGALFSLSLAYTVFGLSIAAVPLVVYLFQAAADGQRSFTSLLLIFFVGWNSALVLTGIFLLAVLPFLRSILFGKRPRATLSVYAAYGAGLFAGSAGLLYATVTGVPLNRKDWLLSGVDIVPAVTHFFGNQLSLWNWDFYHVSCPLVFLYLSALAAALILRDRRLWSVVCTIVFFQLLYSVIHLSGVAELRNHVGGLVKTFQFDRFYMLDSTLIVLAWVIAMSAAQLKLRRVLIASASVQLAWILALTPQLRNPILHALGKDSLLSFNQYYKPRDYKMVESAVGGAPVISVGLDPMAAVMNGIGTLDGYYSAYPLSYKASFRSIVSRQLKISHEETYFDNWGNRLYTFVNDPKSVSLDYCSAYSMGGRFVLAGFDLVDPELHLVKVTEPNHLKVYSIDCRSSMAGRMRSR